jgi:hypothetical protein
MPQRKGFRRSIRLHEKSELSILAIQIEKLLVFEVTQQRVMGCLMVSVLKGPTFACLSLAAFRRATLGLALKQN